MTTPKLELYRPTYLCALKLAAHAPFHFLFLFPVPLLVFFGLSLHWFPRTNPVASAYGASPAPKIPPTQLFPPNPKRIDGALGLLVSLSLLILVPLLALLDYFSIRRIASVPFLIAGLVVGLCLTLACPTATQALAVSALCLVELSWGIHLPTDRSNEASRSRSQLLTPPSTGFLFSASNYNTHSRKLRRALIAVSLSGLPVPRLFFFLRRQLPRSGFRTISWRPFAIRPTNSGLATAQTEGRY